MGIPKSVEQAREYSNNINNVDATLMPQNEQNLAIRYALHDIAKQTGEAPAFNFDYSPVDYDDTLSSEIYKPYVNPLQDALGMLLNAVPSIWAAMLSFPTIMASGGISLLNDALERITGDDYDDPKIQAEKKNWFYDPAARGSIEWTNSVNDFFDSWKYKPSDKAQEKLDVTNFWATANPNNVAANIGNGIGSVLGFIGTIALTKGMSGGGSVKLFQGLSNISKAEVLGSYMYMNNEVYNEFRNNAKIDDLTAAKLSSLVSLPIALSEYVGLSALGKVMTKPMVKNAIKDGVEEAIASYGTKGLTKELYQDFTAKAIQGIGNRMTTAALKGAEGAVIEGVQEYGQGKMQQAAEALYDKIANEKVFGTELFDKQALKDDINNAFWGGAIGGLLGMGGGMINSKEMQESVFHYVGINLQKNRPAKIDGVKKFITQLGENGKITPEQTEQGLKMVDEMVAVHKEAMPLSLTDIDARYQAYEFIQARNKIQADLLALDEKPVDPTLAKADSELRTIMEQSAEAYDEAIALIAKTKGQISESELGKKLFEIGTQFNKVEAPKEEVKTDITPIENTEELTTETKVEDKKAALERRRQKELNGQYGAGFRLEKRTENTNEQLTDRNVGSIEKAIQQGIQQGKSASEILGILNALGFIPANIGNGTEALRNYLQSRIDGSNITYQQVHANGILTEINAKYDAEIAALEGKKEEVKVDLAKNDEMLKKAEKALKATITKIEQLKTQPLGAKESQAARDEKIANFEERKKQIETKIGELNAIREAETRVEGVEETGAVVETADTGVSAEEVRVNPDEVVAEVKVEPDVNTQSGIEEAQTDKIIPEQVQNDEISDYGNYLLNEIDKRHKEKYNGEDIKTPLEKQFKETVKDRGVNRAETNLEEIYMNYVPSDVRAATYGVLRSNFEKQQKNDKTNPVNEQANKPNINNWSKEDILSNKDVRMVVSGESIKIDENNKKYVGVNVVHDKNGVVEFIGNFQDAPKSIQDKYQSGEYESSIYKITLDKNLNPENVEWIADKNGDVKSVNDTAKPPKKSQKEKKVESDEEKNIKKDIAYLENKLRNAKGKKESGGLKKQIIQRKKMLKAAQKGEAYVAEQKVNKDYKRGVPKAVKDFVAADTYGMALQYFGSGGRVSRQSFEDATGLFKTEAKEKGAGRKIIKGNEEYDASRSMFSEKAPDYTDVANELTDYQGGEIYDEMVLAMEEVMRMRKADINAEIRRNVEKMQYGGLTKEQANKIEQEEIENAKAEQALINEYEDILAMEQEYLQSQQIGFNERDLNEKIAEAKDEVRLAQQAYDERKAQLGRELANEQPALFEEVKEGMDRGDVNLSQENIDKILMPFKARVETAKRNLEKIDNEEQRNQAKDLDKRQTIIKFEQDIKNAAMEEGDIVDNMDENGDIKQDCQ